MSLTSTYSPLKRLLASLNLASLILVVLLAAPALAAAPAPPSAADAARLAATLEDAKARDALIGQLKLLAAAETASRPAQPGLLERLSDKAGDLRVGLATLAIFVLAVGLTHVERRLVNRLLAAGLAESRANRYLSLLHRILRVLIAVIAGLALAQLWGFDPASLLDSQVGRQVASTLVHIAVVLVGALVFWHLLNTSIERYLTATDSEGNLRQRSGRARTLLPLARNAVFVLLVVMVVLILLSELGVNIAPLLAGAGVLGIAIGFGSQKLVQDIITGVFILFEDTIAVGDSVKLGEHVGTVEAISIRAIRLRDANGSLHTVPFSAVTTVVNATKGFNYALLDVTVDLGEDTDRVVAIMEELGGELQADTKWGSYIAEPIEVLGMEKLDATGAMIRARIKTTPGDRAALIREFNRRIKRRFDAEDIDLPVASLRVSLIGGASTAQ
ncbi:hypothetical protein A6A04_11885 [Paramagnetospirillum marisnigri]|uniref:Small-conductance mechanosensitive channel n=1 Tax=Paramagnetospirillum marisnigri TaxID=1285242 RepID=A0A178MVW8_9PROT|nr:mechanosensitive ion channel domain-containing protein [Paramagnetospirillum marisnigri]OAN54621.1 hypothetical protein A6A04_11885 [Paramagnetospirillum marisnigri]